MSEQPADNSSSFDLLDIRVRKWIWEQNWSELHDIQERSIPVILDCQQDLLLSAATGRGKTEAAFLPICSRIVTQQKKGLQAMYVSPLKALINDQFGRLEHLCERLEIPVHGWHGDISGSKKKRFLDSPSGILLITPESLEAFFVNRGPMVPALFRELGHVVVDEVHSFIGSERGAQLRSLLHRVELAARRRIPRIGLSATLGDMGLAASFLRFDQADQVVFVESKAGGQELQIQLRGYQGKMPPAGSTSDKENWDEAERAIADHLFNVLRGKDNLVFANSRDKVEEFADRLRQMAEDRKLPQEFWPHHGNLSKDVREDVERMLKEAGRPTTAVCTSTLEMGIDIGAVSSVAQVGVPPSVASLRQRLGRSGRRGQAAVLRTYVGEWGLDPSLALQDAIRTRLVACVAMINLLIQGWCEPPIDGAFHFSTLVHQVLSAIAQFGGVRAGEIWKAYCGRGPFHGVSQGDFADLLRSIAAHDLIVQAPDGTLLLGELGEKIVNHYSFYAVFQTPEEYQIIAGAKTLGTLPVSFGIGEGSLIVFAGRRWRVVEVDDEGKALIVEPAPGGVPPRFDGGEIGLTARNIRKEMKRIYESTDVPVYLDKGARALLAEGRAGYKNFGLGKNSILRNGSDVVLFPWDSDQAHNALVLMLRSRGLDASFFGVAVVVGKATEKVVRAALKDIYLQEEWQGATLAANVDNLQKEKFHPFLNEDLLRKEFAGSRVDIPRALSLSKELCDTQ